MCREKSASQDGATLRKESDMHHTLRQRFVNLLHLAVSPTRAGDYDIEALVQEKDVFITPRPLSERYVVTYTASSLQWPFMFSYSAAIAVLGPHA